jgi:hypothetical protein
MGNCISRRDVVKGLGVLGAAAYASGVGISFGDGALSATTYPGA